MLYVNNGTSPRVTVQPGFHALNERDGVWLDLLDPTDQERSMVERLTKLRVPAQADIAEIESSSRLMAEGSALYLSMPLTYRGKSTQASAVSPVGFVLSANHLITVRFAEMSVFDTFAERFAVNAQTTSGGAFVGLLETMVDRLADVLEQTGADLADVSHRIFAEGSDTDGNSNKIDARLRATLRTIGLIGDRLANIRDSLVGAQRIVNYVHDMSADWMDKTLVHRCSTLRADLTSLMDYDAQLGNKVQFLLDATLGFINIEQNNGIKILTVVSVVGVPPTLVASIYGMNFKWIPELQWEYGYFYGLAVILLSAVCPLIWFKKKGWI
ncbi:MAG: magnesium transporter CorA family protein [Acetobacteraceae bacterium]|nr:magnesium transporter CorA family protein [Acetobacteraceae bacterium]